MKKRLLTLTLAIVGFGAVANEMDHSMMDHSKMDHSMMEMKSMDHSDMPSTDGMMNMQAMSDVGMPATGAKPDKVVAVILSDDMRITFKKPVTIEPNDVVQFVVMNTGKIDHEFSIGSVKEQLKHRAMLKNMGDHTDDSGRTVTVKPGKAKQLLWHFHGDTNVELACNIPGHAEAGMVKSLVL